MFPSLHNSARSAEVKPSRVSKRVSLCVSAARVRGVLPRGGRGVRHQERAHGGRGMRGDRSRPGLPDAMKPDGCLRQ